jgi:nucleoside-diphosphate-sugar epimerase
MGTLECWRTSPRNSFKAGYDPRLDRRFDVTLVVQSVSIVGCGYTGRRLARRFLQAGAHVRGFATQPDSLRQIAAVGVEALALDLDGAIDSIDLSGELLYYSVPPALELGDPRLARFLDAVAGTPQRLVYLSTTGVYGDHGGGRVDEDTPPAPLTERAVRRLTAENAVRAWGDSRGVSWCVLRLPGIYGPGRLPLDRLRRGVPAIVAHEAAPGNRIQVTDLVTACVAAGRAEAADRRIFNVTDGSEESATEFLQRVARVARLPPPPLVSRADAMRELSASARSFLAESRRVDNRRMLSELGVTLEYRDLDAGIRASLEDS